MGNQYALTQEQIKNMDNPIFSIDHVQIPIIMFKTFQIDELYKRLFESGCRISSYDPPTEDNINQFRFLKFYDKWGNMLGFIQDPPTVPWYGVK